MYPDLPGYASNSYSTRSHHTRSYDIHSSGRTVGIPGSVTAAKVVLGLTAAFLAINVVVSLSQSTSLPAAAFTIVIGLTVLVGVAAGKVRDSRAWGLSGGSIGIALAGLMLVMMSVVNDARIPASIQSSLNTTLLISAAIYGVLGLTAVCLLNSQSAREYYGSHIRARY